MALHPRDRPSSFGRPNPTLRMSPPLAHRDLLPERRRYQRHALRCECWIEGDEVTIFGPTIDVGIGGLFLRTAIPVSTGAVVDVALKVLGEQAPLAARAVVMRCVPAHVGLRHGIGLEFLEIFEGSDALVDLLQRTVPLPWA
jgi:hypothetical protein